MICSECGNEKNFETRDEEETFIVKGDKIKTLSKITYCEDCGEQVWNPKYDSENLKRAYDIYKKRHNLLSSKQIAQTRNVYGLTSTTFSKILGLEENAITRFENGSIQDAVQNSLIILAKNAENLKTLYKLNEHRLTKAEKEEFKSVFAKFKYTIPKNIEHDSTPDKSQQCLENFIYKGRDSQR